MRELAEARSSTPEELRRLMGTVRVARADGHLRVQGIDSAGAPTKGEIEASDKQTVASQLRTRGLIVVDIEEQTLANAGDLLARFAKIKPDDLVIATRQLSTMVSSGMSSLRALYVIEEQTESDKLRDLDRGAHDRGRRGALGRAPAPPRGVQRALRGEGAGRRDRRHPGPGRRARRGAAREGRRPAAADQGGDGLPCC